MVLSCEFFSGHRLLVIVDDVWKTPPGSCVRSWTDALSKITDVPGSAMVMTTRDKSLAGSPGFFSLPLGRLDLAAESPHWTVAETVYDASVKASGEVQASESYKKNRRQALRLSCGLPLGITTFAGLVDSYTETPDDVGDILSSIEQRVHGLACQSTGEDQKAVTGHAGLHAAIKESLNFLDERERQIFAVRVDADRNCARLFSASYDSFPGKFFSARYVALEMLPASSTSISFELLCQLWHVSTVAEAKKIAMTFVNIGLGRLEGGGSSGQERVFALHDLQYEYCHDVRGGPSLFDVALVGGTSLHKVNGHALVLCSFESLLDIHYEVEGEAASELPKVVGKGWVSLCFGEGRLLVQPPLLRQYFAENLFRHLCATISMAGAGGVRCLLLTILADFRWLRGRIVEYGRSAAMRDLKYARTVSSDDNNVMLLAPDTERSIRALGDALMLVKDRFVATSDGTLASSLFQLSSLSRGTGQADLDTDFLEKLAESVESDVLGAWLKPIMGCSLKLEQNILVEAIVGDGGRVECLAELGDGKHFVSGSSDGVVRVHETAYLESVLELRGHTDAVVCVTGTKCERREGRFFILSGGDDGTVRAWEVDLNSEQGAMEIGCYDVYECESPVKCLSVSNCGAVVAAGCQNGLVYVWKSGSEDSGIGMSYGLLTSWRCSVGDEKSLGDEWSESVIGLAVSKSGDLVVAGARNGAIAFWNCLTNGTEGEVEIVSACAEGEGDSRRWRLARNSLLLSENDSLLFVGFHKPASYEVWDPRNIDVSLRRRRASHVVFSERAEMISAAFVSSKVARDEGCLLRDELLVYCSTWGGGERRTVVAKYSGGNDP